MSADPTLAIDLGGTKTLAGLVLDGRVVESRTQPTDREASAETWLDTIAALADGWRNRFEAVAIAVSGVVVDGRWSSLNPGVLNVPDDFPLVARLNDRLGVPVLAVNDAQAAAWGEFRHGAGNGADSIVFITVSTGLGGGVVLNRELLIGSSGLAGSFGQFAARVEGAGRLEDSLSGQWIASQSAWLGYQNDTAWVIDAANRGEAWADEIIETSVTRLAALLADLQYAFDPERFVIGGGVGLAPGYLLRLRYQIEGMSCFTRPNLLPADLGPRAGIIGAADLAADRIGTQTRSSTCIREDKE